MLLHPPLHPVLGIKKAPLDLSNGVILHGNFDFFVVTAEGERLQTM